MKRIEQCLIVGAGMTGLMAAHKLQAHGVKITVLDKGRSVGGRMATRWIETAAGPEFTRQHLDTDLETVAKKLLQAVGKWLRSSVKSWQVHRWLYSQPQITHPESCLLVNGEAPLVFAGDAFGAPRVEGAVLSGIAAAEALLGI